MHTPSGLFLEIREGSAPESSFNSFPVLPKRLHVHMWMGNQSSLFFTMQAAFGQSCENPMPVILITSLKREMLQHQLTWLMNNWSVKKTLNSLRTITHESTGFSAAELVHGKNLRTSEILLYEHWVKPQETDSPVVEYVFELINRIRKCQELAIEKMTEVQPKRKIWYDRNVVRRKFQVGDQVLVLATSKPNKMAVQWTGPGVIESQRSVTNYIVKIASKNDKTQIYHVNLLKPYHQRPEKINLLISERKETPETESDELGIPYPTSDPNVYDFE
ncbi:hypothetical protein AVEN_59011-1 [Araneus ventricosus]|uniref:Uncharacterized protein n=1 Tax=Araneus ventricosus TaxID=182803 RepID=A0A4Y2QRW1_ARAVE|nr:hypothetical protein AVEN_59011-1 [Araneus ventricosus]